MKWSTCLRSQFCFDTLSFHPQPHSKISYLPHPNYEETIPFKNKTPTIKCPTYCKPSTCIPPEPNSTNLSLFLEQIQDPLHNHTQHIIRSNVTSQRRFSLKKLGSHPDLAIQPFDKGSGICLMDTSLYINKIEEHLADPTTYKEVNTNPTETIRNDVLCTFDYLHSTHRIDDETRHHLPH